MMHVSCYLRLLHISLTFISFQHCAQTLLDFNGGASCVQVYVNQHDFFINRVRAVENIDTRLYVPFKTYLDA